MPKLVKISLLALSVLLVLTLFLGVNSRGVSAATVQEGDGAYRQINVYSEVLRHIQTDYVEEPNIHLVTDGALRGLLESLDADSSYITPAAYKIYKAGEKGKAQVGINVSKRNGYAIVVSVVPGSPADKANLNDGDWIEAIGPVDTGDLSLAMIQMLLSGQPGSEINLSIVNPRKSLQPQKVVLTRSMPSFPPVAESMYENSTILYLKPGVLDHDHVSQIEGKLRAMPRAGNKKILLDLRDVAAGDMTEATRLANFLLKDGTIASLEGQKVQKQVFTADPSKAIQTSAPAVVLINHGTAGPGELVAAALADNHRADLVGEKTFGEGAQQKTFELPDGAALILSVAKYEAPSGKRLQDDGVTPGILVAGKNAAEDAASEDEDAPASTAKPTNTAKSGVTVDEQLSKALDVLKSKAA